MSVTLPSTGVPFTPWALPTHEGRPDRDEMAAAWRLFAAQIDGSSYYKDVKDIADKLKTALKGYKKNRREDRLKRFKLQTDLGVKTDVGSYLEYESVLEDNANKKAMKALNALITHASVEWQVRRDLIAGITVGNLKSDSELEELIVEDLLAIFGGSAPFDIAPIPSHYTKYKGYFAQSGGYGYTGSYGSSSSSTGSRRSKKRRYYK